LDGDSDNDGLPDDLEGWDFDGDGVADQTATGSDSDGDGLDDGYDRVDNSGTVNDGTNNTGPTDYPDVNIPGGDRDWREYVAEPSLEVFKQGHFNDENGDGLAQVGETVTYTFVVRNTGNVTVTGITLRDDTATVSGGPIDLDAGDEDSTTFTAVHVITREDLDNGRVVNHAQVSGYAPNGDEVTDWSDDPSDLTDADIEGDDEPDDPTVVEVKGIEINTLFTPNEDGVNDTWVVHGITHFPNRVEVYNRWGNLVYKAENYKNDWDGRANVPHVMGRGQYLPAGTYYYIIYLNNGRRYAGYLYLNK